MASLEQLQEDLAELNKFQAEARRPRVQNLLSVEIRKVESSISSIQEQQLQQQAPSATSQPRATSQVFTQQIKKYAWDQSDKFMKLYVTLNGVQGINADNVKSEFTNQSVKLTVANLDGKNHELYISKLCEEITPSGSYHKIKSDCVLLMLKKASTQTWAYVTSAEKKSKETKKPDVDKDEDPNASLMKMMQKMYDEGDDEMKQTIAKAWSQSKDKEKF